MENLNKVPVLPLHLAMHIMQAVDDARREIGDDRLTMEHVMVQFAIEERAFKTLQGVHNVPIGRFIDAACADAPLAMLAEADAA